MVKIWVNTKQGLKQVEIRKVRGSDVYEYVKGKKKKRKISFIGKIPPKRRKSRKRKFGRKAIKKKVEKEQFIKGVGTKRKFKPRKPRKIDDVFDKKVIKKEIKNFLDIPTNQINGQYKSLLKGALSKKGLGDFASDDVLNAMIRQENINKIKWRFDIRADVYDRDGTKVLQMIKGSGGDLMSLRENMKKGIWRGASVDYDIDIGDGYKFNLVNKGNVDRVNVTIIFRS